jgi:hypothetical protein
MSLEIILKSSVFLQVQYHSKIQYKYRSHNLYTQYYSELQTTLLSLDTSKEGCFYRQIRDTEFQKQVTHYFTKNATNVL